MEIKYTKKGLKVAVLGKLNNEQFICQEIYVSGGKEFPSGENFVESNLLDAPALSWAEKNAKELEERKIRLEREIESMQLKSIIAHNKFKVVDLINAINKRYENIDISQLETLFSLMAGEITHAVIKRYDSYKILPLDEALKDEETHYGNPTIDGLKLVSLYGVCTSGKRWGNEKEFRLDYRINQYRDGSGGSNVEANFFKSYEEAVSFVDNQIVEKDATDGLINTKNEYGLKNPSEEKIKVYRDKMVISKTKEIEYKQNELSKLNDELEGIILDLRAENNDLNEQTRGSHE